MNTLDLTTPAQWGPVQQTLFTQIDNVSQDETNKRLQKMNQERDSSAVGETSQDNTMWQGNKQQELIQGQWTDFSSNSNQVFAPENTAWGVAENVAVDDDENDKDSSGEARNSSNSSNSSESENEQETEENVWKINEEQRAYYLNQFKVLQPAEKGVVTGQKARDFFIKSGLSTDVLSRIWNLADLDNDGALNFDEFCVAMHVVVAVRHGVEVPTVLPPYLIPEQYEKQVPVVSPQKVETSSKEQLPVPDTSQKWARFSPDPDNPPGQVVSPEEDVPKTPQPVTAPTHHQRVERSMSDPSSMEETLQKDTSSTTPARKTSVGIPRMRGNVKKTNLLDTPHWAILPPPSKFTKEADDIGKSVPIGTIIPDDSNDNGDAKVPQPGLLKVENVERPSPRDSHSDSSSSDEGDQKERPSSLTNEQLNSDSSGSLSKSSSRESGGASHDSVDAASTTSAPVPPPRKKVGHSRSSSLDLQKLFNNKGGSNSFQQTLENGSSASEQIKRHSSPKFGNNGLNDGEDTTQQPKDNQENFADFSKFETVTINHPTTTENTGLFRHRRSASLSSLDSTHAIWVEPSPPQEKQQEEVKNSLSIPKISSSLPRPVPKKKPASPPPPVRQKKDPAQLDSGSDNITEKERKTNKEPIHFVVKPLTRLEQLHARIRDLKTKNTTLSRVNNELQQELKEIMEKRIELESTVEQFKPLSNE